jgi:chromate transporter
MQRVLRVVKPICVAMISGVLVTLFQSSILPGRRLDLAALGIAVLCFVLLRTRKCSIPAVIGLAAALGVVCYGVVPIL